MAAQLGKASIEHLQAFLTKHGEYWNATGVDESPLTTEQLVNDLRLKCADHTHVYLIDDPTELKDQTLNDAFEVKPADFERFVLRQGGSDFLYLYTDDNSFSNHQHIEIHKSAALGKSSD